jgi:hypothetical protein
MSRALLLLLVLLPACGAAIDPVQAQRRGAVELAVKGGYPAILDEIEAGTGPNLWRAFDAAGVPISDRSARTTQLQGDLGLFEANPGALVAAILLYGHGRADQSASVVR